MYLIKISISYEKEDSGNGFGHSDGEFFRCFMQE
jgi:hypothetical protein